MTQARSGTKGKVRPLPGTSPHDRAGQPWGFFHRQRRIATIPYLCHFNEPILGPQYAFSRHRGIYRSDVVRTTTNPGTGADLLPSLGPRSQAKERVGRTTLFSSSAMSSDPAIP